MATNQMAWIWQSSEVDSTESLEFAIQWVCDKEISFGCVMPSKHDEVFWIMVKIVYKLFPRIKTNLSNLLGSCIWQNIGESDKVDNGYWYSSVCRCSLSDAINWAFRVKTYHSIYIVPQLYGQMYSELNWIQSDIIQYHGCANMPWGREAKSSKIFFENALARSCIYTSHWKVASKWVLELYILHQCRKRPKWIFPPNSEAICQWCLRLV